MTTRTKVWFVAVVAFLVGALVASNVPYLRAQPAAEKGPKWSHGMEVKVRKVGDSEWKDAKKVAIEVFKDENNGNLIYVSENGSISVVPGK